MKDLNEERDLTLTAASYNLGLIDRVAKSLLEILAAAGPEIDYSITVTTEEEPEEKHEG